MTDATLLGAPAATAPALTLELVYLARLREALGRTGETVTLPRPAAPTVEWLLGELRLRGGAFARELAPGRSFRVAVDQAMAGGDTPLHDGAEVALFPPVTGG